MHKDTIDVVVNEPITARTYSFTDIDALRGLLLDLVSGSMVPRVCIEHALAYPELNTCVLLLSNQVSVAIRSNEPELASKSDLEHWLHYHGLVL